MFRAKTLMLVLALPAVFVRAQDSQLDRAADANANTVALQGKVVSPKGQPLAGMHIELDQAGTALPLTSTFTHPDGTFEMYNIPKGEYEVVAESVDTEVSNVITVDHQHSRVELRFESGRNTTTETAATVSVAQILAPEKAQKLYGRAREAFRRGEISAARTLTQQALQVEPHYADALTLQGLIELSNADPRVPQQSFEQALQLNPNDSSASIALAAVYNRLSRFDDALRLAQHAASLAAKSWQAYLEIAKACIAKNLFAEGLVAIRQAERLGGTRYAEVHLIKAYGLFHMNFYRESKYEAQAALTRDHNGGCTEHARSLLAELASAEMVVAAER
jgi:tetratricopeptide (TPR) repeat protein